MSPDEDQRSRSTRLYGIQEIARVVGVSPRLVASWRQRGSHGIPEPDENLASGAVWFAETIEPWLERYRATQRPDATAQSEALVRKLARRTYRLAAVLNEEPPVRDDVIRDLLRDLMALEGELRDLERAPPRGLGSGIVKTLYEVVMAIGQLDSLAAAYDTRPGDLRASEHLRRALSSDLTPAVTRVLQEVDWARSRKGELG